MYFIVYALNYSFVFTVGCATFTKLDYYFTVVFVAECRELGRSSCSEAASLLICIEWHYFECKKWVVGVLRR